jgi:hypothetical protein
VIIRLSPDRPPVLDDLDRLDRLHATTDGPLAGMQLDDLCCPDDDAHVWLDVAAARAAGIAATGDPTFGERYDAMIAYAASKGWLDDGGTHVRAHVETEPG